MPRYRTKINGLRLVREASFPLPAPEERCALRSPKDAAKFVAVFFEPELAETFAIVALDAQHRAINDAIITITRGIVNSSLVHPREVFRAAITAGAVSIILFHNHPSGDPTPSADDRLVTEQLVAAGRLLEIPVLDHVIVGTAGKFVSFAEAGLL